MSSNLIGKYCFKSHLNSTQHYSPTQAASSFLIQPSLQSWQSLLLEPVQVLQAAWQAETRENYNLSFVERFQKKFGHTNSQRNLIQDLLEAIIVYQFDPPIQKIKSLLYRDIICKTCSSILKKTPDTQNKTPQNPDHFKMLS